MAQKIYNNGSDGKILMSSAGKVIRQPYEFGNAFQNRVGLNNYFELSGITFPDTYSFLYLCYVVGLNVSNGLCQIISTTGNGADNIEVRSPLASRLLVNIWDTLPFNDDIVGINANIPILYLSSSQSYYSAFQQTTKKIVAITSSRNTSIRDKIRIGATGNVGNNTVPIVNYLNANTKLNRVYMFDRELSLQEILYYGNNYLFSELQAQNGLIHDWKFDHAEDKNDLPCVPDLVGSYHLPIMNLPAGTLEEKLAYANTNLFVPFLT